MQPKAAKASRLLAEAVSASLIESAPKGRSLGAFRASLRKAGWIPERDIARLSLEAWAFRQSLVGFAPDEIPLAMRIKGQGIANIVNRELRKEDAKAKESYVKARMAINRSNGGPIFYLVSTHQKPAEGHAHIQGAVLVDRFWRGSVQDEALTVLIERKIKEDGIRTVQWAMGAPTYLITRPNCHHKLYPIRTEEALQKSASELKSSHREARIGEHRSKSDARLYAERKALFMSFQSDAEAMLRDLSS